MEIEISGVVGEIEDLTHDEWLDKFIEWVESNNWLCGITTEDITTKEQSDG